jgi:hypothetical protein
LESEIERLKADLVTQKAYYESVFEDGGKRLAKLKAELADTQDKYWKKTAQLESELAALKAELAEAERKHGFCFACSAELKAQPASEPVASIYVNAFGEREFDDWKVPLPAGRNLLFATPQPSAEVSIGTRNIRATESAEVELRNAANALIDQIDTNDFTDSLGHHAKNLKALHDLMRLCSTDEAMKKGEKE